MHFKVDRGNINRKLSILFYKGPFKRAFLKREHDNSKSRYVSKLNWALLSKDRKLLSF